MDSVAQNLPSRTTASAGANSDTGAPCVSSLESPTHLFAHLGDLWNSNGVLDTLIRILSCDYVYRWDKGLRVVVKYLGNEDDPSGY
jgi:hypothetical protein